MRKTSESNIQKPELTSIAEGAGITFVGKIIECVFMYSYLIIVARLFGAESLGLLMLGLTIINIAAIISRLGLDSGVIKYLAVYSGNNDKQRVKGIIAQSLKYSLIASAFLGILLFLTAKSIFVNIYGKTELENVIKFLSISLPFLSVTFIALSSTYGLQIMRYKVYALNIFLPLSNLAFVIIIFLAGLKLNGIAAAYSVSAFLTCIVSLYFMCKVFRGLRHIKAIPETRKLFRFSIPLLLFFFLNSAIQWTDTLMLGYFQVAQDIGIYNAALKTALLTSTILMSFNAIFAPIIADLCNKKEFEKLGSLFKTVTKWIFTACFPVFLLIVLLSKEIMTLFGEEFLIGCIPLVVLSFCYLANGAAGSVGLILTMSGKQDIMMYNTFGVCILNIILNYILIPRYGMIGASVATGISIIILNIIMLVEVYLLMKMHPYNWKFLKPAIFGMISFGIILFMKNILLNFNWFLQLLVYISLFIVIFVCLMVKWGIDGEDKFIINVFKMRFLKTLS